MATSGVYSITVTAQTLFSAVLEELGVLAAGGNGKAGDIATVKQRANLWLLQQNGRPNALRPGEMMWTRESGTITLDITTNEYELKSTGGDLDIQIPSDIHSILYRDADDNDTPLKSMTWFDYQAISDKDGTGTPQRYHYQKQLAVGMLYLDVVPDVANELIVNYKQPLELIDGLTNEFDTDPSWYLTMLYNFAYHCTGPFQTPMERMGDIKQKAIESMAAMSSLFPDDKELNMRPI
jgi:hypothetical protein